MVEGGERQIQGRVGEVEGGMVGGWEGEGRVGEVEEEMREEEGVKCGER